MKKIITLLCMIICVFSLAGCGETRVLSEHEQSKVDRAKEKAVEMIDTLEKYSEESLRNEMAEYTMEEVEDWVLEEENVDVEGYAFVTAAESFASGIDEIGSIASKDQEVTATLSGKQIIVHVNVTGQTGKQAQAELIYSNDKFLVLESAALNPQASFGQMMKKAGLNTLIGMATVFTVLILISLIIACFGIIPKIQKRMADKKNAQAPAKESAPVLAAQETSATEETDDLELVAVIAAAIAASEGRTSTDGFVVRSIRRRY